MSWCPGLVPDIVPDLLIKEKYKIVVYFGFQYLMMRGQLKEALWVATAAHEGNINPPKITAGAGDSMINGVITGKEYDGKGLLAKTTESLANWYFRVGQPMSAACCHFAVEEKRVN